MLDCGFLRCEGGAADTVNIYIEQIVSMEQYGNDNFNVERVLRENINGHEYMRRTARELATWDAVIDEIFNTVDQVEPWMSGNVRGPSTAFCLLYRLFELKITEDQVHETISCKDSAYIRAVRKSRRLQVQCNTACHAASWDITCFLHAADRLPVPTLRGRSERSVVLV